MNIKDSQYQRYLEKYLQSLNLTDHNLQLGRDYLSDPEAPDSLLETAEKQQFSNRLVFGADRHDMIQHSDADQMARVLKFLWAVGGRTACHPWGMGFYGMSFRGDSCRWRAKVLGSAAAVCLEATVFGSNRFNSDTVSWLLELGRTDPAALIQAQSQLGPLDEGMKLVLSAVLLRSSTDKEVLAKQRSILETLIGNGMKTLLGPTAGAEVGLLMDYIRSGDRNCAPPVPPRVPNPCVDARSSLNITLALDHWTLSRLSLVSMIAAGKEDVAFRTMKTLMMLGGVFTWNALSQWCPRQMLLDDAEILKAVTPGGASTILMMMSSTRAYLSARFEHTELAACFADDMVKAKREADCFYYVQLLSLDPEPLPAQEVREKVIADLCGRVTGGGDELRSWLLGACAGMGPVTPKPDANLVGLALLLREMVLAEGWTEFAVRSVKACLELWEGRSMAKMLFDRRSQLLPEMIEGMVAHLTAADVSVVRLLDLFAEEYDSIYSDSDKRTIRDTATKAVTNPAYIGGLLTAVSKCGLMGRWAALTALNALADTHPAAKPGVLAAAGDSSKQIRELAMTFYAARPEWAADFEDLLKAKKAGIRLMGVEALGKLNFRAPLEKALEGEKNAKVADAIRAVLGAEAPASNAGSAAELAAELTKGNKLKKLSWLLGHNLPKVRRADGTPAEDVIRDAILLSYCELGRVGRSDTAAKLAEDLCKSDLEKLACEVYELWFSAGAQAKHKWVLPFAAVYGGTAMTPRLQKAIHDWPEHQRGAIACDAVMALAMSTDPAAIVIVDGLSRKFKFRQVKQAAAAALENAAQELGITAEELADRIVPDLGFGRDGRRTFDYGKRSFTVRLTPTLELEIVNDQGKAVKNMPAPGKTDDPAAAEAYEAFKTMKKQIKATVTAQRARLEAALSAARFWDTDRWQALFVENPIMHQFAMSLIWGVYQDGRLTDTFRYMEDGTFNTVDEDEYTLPEKALIGLVHPVELDADTLDGWKQQLADYEITQSIDQLSRQVFTLDESRAGEKVLEDFGGKILNGLSLSGKMLSQGWYRGSVQDGGVFYCFYREDKDLGIGAELRFSGSAVGFDDGDSVTVYDAVFYTGSINRGSYVYDKVPEEKLVPLGEVPARYYSEILLHLTKATASSTETYKNWKDDRSDC